jgi:hypothetical protein
MRSARAILETVLAPVATFRALAESPRSLLVLLFIIGANLMVPLALSGKLAARQAVLTELGPKLSEMSDREVDEAVTQKQKLVEFAAVAKAVASPPLLALELAIVLWLWARYLRDRPAFGSLFSLCAHAQIPLALRSLAQALVIVSRPRVAPDELTALVPSNLGALGHGSLVLGRALGGADLFLIWTAVLLGIALYSAGKLSGVRAAMGMAVAYAAFVAVFLVGLPGLGAA